MANDILSQFNPADFSLFKKDFMQFIKTGAEMDRFYGEAQEMNSYIPKFKRLTEDFNKKYSGIKIKLKETLEHFKTRILVKSPGIKDFFADSASKLPGLKAVGRTNFNQVETSNAEAFARFLDMEMDKIFLSYSNPENGTSSFEAAYDRNEKMVEIICNAEDMMNENSAPFRVCAFYALKEGIDKKIKIHEEASTFGFWNLLRDTEKKEWIDRFNPRAGE